MSGYALTLDQRDKWDCGLIFISTFGQRFDNLNYSRFDNEPKFIDQN